MTATPCPRCVAYYMSDAAENYRDRHAEGSVETFGDRGAAQIAAWAASYVEDFGPRCAHCVRVEDAHGAALDEDRDRDELAAAVPPFYLDLVEDVPTLFPALGYDTPWNSWATPIVDAATLVALVEHVGDGWTVEIRDNGGAVLEQYGDLDTVLDPDPRGRYHLSAMGWTLVADADGSAAWTAVTRDMIEDDENERYAATDG